MVVDHGYFPEDITLIGAIDEVMVFGLIDEIFDVVGCCCEIDIRLDAD